MRAPSAVELERARDLLRGQIVSTPLIGALHLPGFAAAPDLRVKPEVLQPAGSIYVRGALHYLTRTLGRLKGVAIHGSGWPVLAAAQAAKLHRVAAIAFTVGEPSFDVWSRLTALDCEVRPRPTAEQARASADELHARTGVAVMPFLEHADYALGIATLGAELAGGLPRETETVVVSPAHLADAVALGLAASGRDGKVQGVAVTAAPEGLAEAVRLGLRLMVDLPSLSALQWGLSRDLGPSPCVVLAC